MLTTKKKNNNKPYSTKSERKFFISCITDALFCPLIVCFVIHFSILIWHSCVKLGTNWVWNDDDKNIYSYALFVVNFSSFVVVPLFFFLLVHLDPIAITLRHSVLLSFCIVCVALRWFRSYACSFGLFFFFLFPFIFFSLIQALILCKN